MLPSLISWLWLAAALALAESQEPYFLTGAPVSSKSGSVPLRREISELFAEGGAQWDVYIRSLQAMQEKNHSDPLSYFQVSGIHGRPAIEWNGAGDRLVGDEEWSGYCPHGEKLFLPWHRAFILLFEQVMAENAMKIAQEYPQRYRYQYVKAAETLRSPYWDWAANTDVPTATIPDKIRVNVPRGQHLEQIEVDNPLLTFKFPEAALQGVYGDFDNRTKMYRCESPESYPESANALTAARPYKQMVYDAFTRSENFSAFASTRDGGLSLEQIHNALHWDAACAGQFLTATYSAFDPIFILHHTNSDRLWAYWQAIHPDHASFGRAYKGGSRYSTTPGTVIGPDSPLQPFFKSKDEFHTSRSIANISAFGYSYQGLEYWDKSEDQMSADAKRLINQLYGPSDRSKAKFQNGHDNRTTQYFARVKVEASEVERPCAVEIYVGGRLAGGMVVMEHPSRGTVHGEISLEEALDATYIRQLSPRKTLDAIQSSLEVALIKTDGTTLSSVSEPSIRVEIEYVLVEPAITEDDLPTFRNIRRLPVATRQRAV